jgi:hypothetical protein
MTRKKEEAASLDTLLMELEPHMRQTAAAARNASIEKRDHHEAMLDASKREKAHMRTLHIKYELSLYRIARICDLSESRVRAILDGVRRQR